ncbi:MAG: hypothetical protein HRT53_21380 [Colwellia sp.]|nr:hypothetical protein [Colwellia sp.]
MSASRSHGLYCQISTLASAFMHLHKGSGIFSADSKKPDTFVSGFSLLEA